ncbi:GNAT family N-acetyltransferase [Microlunatus sp. Y2014]|uniref:GNAT family N-acetyltransferase n=1 Tax=Microlunatus sp. Y2014 TaxID=3418488 RepID=UPI003DA77B18
MDLERIWPPYAVRVTSGDLELRVIRQEDAPELVDLVLDGVHEPEVMPFSIAWTDAPRDELPENYLRYVARKVANFDKSAPQFDFVVRLGGQVVGVQAFGGASDFVVTRTGETGSWLGKRFQGRGIGTRMRRLVCAFAFDALGATEITSGAFVDNAASLAVSRKVGYQPNGLDRTIRRGELVMQQRLVLTPDDFDRGPESVMITGSEGLSAFLHQPVRVP